MFMQLAPQTEAFWWITLAIGAVVLLVLVFLLQLLSRVVADIDAELHEIWRSGKLVARNTATSWMIPSTSLTLAVLDEELEAVADWRKQ